MEHNTFEQLEWFASSPEETQKLFVGILDSIYDGILIEIRRLNQEISRYEKRTSRLKKLVEYAYKTVY